jgi:CheY-like chemotaxis protein
MPRWAAEGGCWIKTSDSMIQVGNDINLADALASSAPSDLAIQSSGRNNAALKKGLNQVEAAFSRIILAEDNPGDVWLVREVLRQHEIKCELEVVSDGEQMVSFIQRLELNSNVPCPNLLLLDLHLPKRDGNEILIHLRASERCGQTRVIVLTSSDAPADRVAAKRNAALHYFRKPSSFGQFLKLGDIVKDVLNRSCRQSQGNGSQNSYDPAS